MSKAKPEVILRGVYWGAAFGVLAGVLQHSFGTTSAPDSVPYYLGAAIGGGLLGMIVAKLAA